MSNQDGQGYGGHDFESEVVSSRQYDYDDGSDKHCDVLAILISWSICCPSLAATSSSLPGPAGWSSRGGVGVLGHDDTMGGCKSLCSEALSWPLAVNGSVRGTWAVSDAYGRIGYRTGRLTDRGSTVTSTDPPCPLMAMTSYI